MKTNDCFVLQDIEEMQEKYLIFTLDEQLYAIPIAYVMQIIGVPVITSMPQYPPYVKGIINLRGQIVPIVGTRLRLGKMEKPYDERTCIVVIEIDNATAGLVVDGVDSVTKIPTENVMKPPSSKDGQEESFLCGIAKHQNDIILLLNIEKLTDKQEQ